VIEFSRFAILSRASLLSNKLQHSAKLFFGIVRGINGSSVLVLQEIRMKKIALLVLGLAFLCVCDAGAHHSFAMFDGAKTVIVEGTVKSWEWKSPHAWLTVDVMDPNTQKVEEWGLEGYAIGTLRGMGYARDSLKAGDKVSVTINPRRNGAPGGFFLSVKLGDGRVLGRPTRQTEQ